MGACQAPSKDYKFYIIQPKCVFPMNYQDTGSSMALAPECSGGMLIWLFYSLSIVEFRYRIHMTNVVSFDSKFFFLSNALGIL